MTSAGIGHADTVTAAVPGQDCPALYVLGVQGTSESSPTADPFADSGMLGEMFRPMLAEGAGIQRAYVPYVASFGGAIGTGPGTDPYARSVQAADAALDAMASQVVARCPHTMLAVAGYSQGAQALSDFAQRVGSGQGPVPPDRIAGIALISDPARPHDEGPLPGRPGQTTPSPAPSTNGATVAGMQIPQVPQSGGIADRGADFGALTGRVAEFCTPGDLACDAPGRAAALRTAAGIAARADLRDPVAVVSSLAAASSQTFAEASAQALLSDVTVDGGQVDYRPVETISQRLADAADPRSPVSTVEQTQAAHDKVNAVVAAVVADPVGQIPRLVGQIGAAVGTNIDANDDLLNPAVLLHYSDVVARHDGYGATGQTATAADWFAGLSHDLAAGAEQ
jgi:hypothetical protein